jgi:hypothetical protein
MSIDDEERIPELLRREASHGRQHTSDSHTDELFLVQEWIEPAFQGVTFNLRHGTMDAAYLILGYRGGGRAYFRLSLGAQQQPQQRRPIIHA